MKAVIGYNDVEGIWEIQKGWKLNDFELYDALEMLLVVVLKYTNCHWSICQKTTYVCTL